MFKKRDMAPDAKLTGLDYLGYFFGAGTNILNLIVSVFLLIYYSNVLYLGLTEVGTVMAVSKVFDGVSDLIMGRIIDKTKSKYGKARPWYARMIIPTTVCVLLLFWMPAGFKGMMQYVYVFVTYNLVSTVCYTANAVAHASMIGFMTMNTKSRGMVGVMSMASNTVFTILVTNFFMKICRFFGGGDAYTQKGFTCTLICYIVLYAVSAILAFLLTRERINNVMPAQDTEEDVPIKVALLSLVQNKYWILCNVMCLGFYFLMSFASSATVYFAQYIMKDLDLQGTLSSTLYIVLLFGLVAALPVMMKIGKGNTMRIGLIISAIGYFIPQLTLQKSAVVGAMAIVGIGFGFIAAPAGSFLQDTLTFGQWRSGVSAIGMGNAVFSFVNKLSSALGIVVLGWVLDLGKFDAKLSVQPASALSAIKFLYIWLPALICVICVFLSAFYDLDKKLPFLEKEITAGRIGTKKRDWKTIKEENAASGK
ncbi:MFS transporter [Mediterraneibacter faecis]|uniref:MFS transporter n=1 Tax=Mediterraneibacter faecis TaxID=592978 RepID=UPI001D079CD4|nr:MFS transporter [Mediterraneibacter faecis]MCB5891333.1 MFS transporter [Lachnospiraceae bacterium 210521-DFI.4.71]MCB7114466.1 MFS transporter [Mediterraneibacter faecis]MCB7117606.1 MFS transporter [Mediterraneibacter faecis]MCB7290234.1 MFS transporter [Mediterraneibacter faecis]MCB7425864.1 MFS transporter [Mediterraneibacter faecis]